MGAATRLAGHELEADRLPAVGAAMTAHLRVRLHQLLWRGTQAATPVGWVVTVVVVFLAAIFLQRLGVNSNWAYFHWKEVLISYCIAGFVPLAGCLYLVWLLTADARHGVSRAIQPSAEPDAHY
jgi:hypothetical protein